MPEETIGKMGVFNPDFFPELSPKTLGEKGGIFCPPKFRGEFWGTSGLHFFRRSKFLEESSGENPGCKPPIFQVVTFGLGGLGGLLPIDFGYFGPEGTLKIRKGMFWLGDWTVNAFFWGVFLGGWRVGVWGFPGLLWC